MFKTFKCNVAEFNVLHTTTSFGEWNNHNQTGRRKNNCPFSFIKLAPKRLRCLWQSESLARESYRPSTQSKWVIGLEWEPSRKFGSIRNTIQPPMIMKVVEQLLLLTKKFKKQLILNWFVLLCVSLEWYNMVVYYETYILLRRVKFFTETSGNWI